MTIAMLNETAPSLLEMPRGEPDRLWALLDRWMTLDETQVTSEDVEVLYRQIVAFWRDAPDEAEGWYEAWGARRAACHP